MSQSLLIDAKWTCNLWNCSRYSNGFSFYKCWKCLKINCGIIIFFILLLLLFLLYVAFILFSLSFFGVCIIQKYVYFIADATKVSKGEILMLQDVGAKETIVVVVVLFFSSVYRNHRIVNDHHHQYHCSIYLCAVLQMLLCIVYHFIVLLPNWHRVYNTQQQQNMPTTSADKVRE